MSSEFIVQYLEAELPVRLALLIRYMQICKEATGGLTYYVPLATLSPFMRSYNSDEKAIKLHEEFEKAWAQDHQTLTGGVIMDLERLSKYVELMTFLRTLKAEFKASLICHSCLLQSGFTLLRSAAWSKLGENGKCNICEKKSLITHPQAIDKIIEFGLHNENRTIEVTIIQYLVHTYILKDGTFNSL